MQVMEKCYWLHLAQSQMFQSCYKLNTEFMWNTENLQTQKPKT